MNCKLGNFRRAVSKGNALIQVFFYPVIVLVVVSGIYNQKEFLLIIAVNKEVIYDSALFVTHKGVAYISVSHSANVVCNKGIYGSFGIVAFNIKLSHM